MGLSSSQARLLSITARLTDNEYRTQRLTNARLKLTDISDAARVQYQNALDSDKFVYMAFDSTGANVKTDLTPAVLYQYQPSKNQYALVNNANKILVSSVDAKNFEETDTLAEFLKRYDCLDNVSETTKHMRKVPVEKDNPEYIAAIEKYNKDHADWEQELAQTPPTLEIEGEPAYTQRVHSSDIWREVMYTGCIDNAISDSNCYMHVLASLLGPGKHTTTPDPVTGETHEFIIYDGVGRWDNELNDYVGDVHYCEDGDGHEYWCWDTDRHPVSKELREQLQNTYCCDCTHDREVVDICDAGGTLKKTNVQTYEFHCENPDGSPMTVYQKLVDLLWEVHGDYTIGHSTGGYVDTEIEKIHAGYFWHFIEFDLDEAEIIEHPAVPGGEIENPAYQPLLDREPQEPDLPKTIIEYEDEVYNVIEEKLTIIDPEKAQWYTNLWYRMNGMDEPEKIYKDVNDVVNDRQEDTTRTDYLLKLFDLQKQAYFVNYDVLDSNLVSSKDWLNNALSQGLVTMQKVGASRTVDNDKFKWSSIIYTNATDIISQKDDTKIAQAEARYTQVLSEVNAKDKVFENKIRKLDTEHNALQTEYNSVKAAMDKNIERSFKAFQG